jgi:flagellar biosynthetic protein FliQ
MATTRMLSEIAVQEVSREAIWVMLKVGAPVMFVALLVGLVVSLLQALTQVQEMTLTFVPKIVAIFLTLLVATPFMLATLVEFTHDVFARIAGVHVG